MYESFIIWWKYFWSLFFPEIDVFTFLLSYYSSYLPRDFGASEKVMSLADPLLVMNRLEPDPGKNNTQSVNCEISLYSKLGIIWPAGWVVFAFAWNITEQQYKVKHFSSLLL
jgi:hypothetical protein